MNWEECNWVRVAGCDSALQTIRERGWEERGQLVLGKKTIAVLEEEAIAVEAESR